MKKIYLVSFLLVFVINGNAQPPLQWARNIGGSRGDNIMSDAAGNVYTTGYFSGTKDFDPSAGTFFLNASGIADDAYISKLDANGNFIWAIQLGGTSTNYNFSVEVDAAGNVYSVGYFSGTVDFDPGPGVYNLTTNGQADISISKLDAAGNFIWAKSIGGSSTEIAYAVLLDQSGNICITGIFVGIVDFDPGPSIVNLDGNGVFGECFILKLDTDGNFLWAKEIDGYFAEGSSITTDATGNLIVCGTFGQTVDLDPSLGVFNITSTGSEDAFIVKLDALGNFIWGRAFGSIGTETCKSVKLDPSGNIFLTGYFSFTADFDPGASMFNITAVGASDAYVVKLDAAGIFVWAKVFSGTAADNANGLDTDAMGNVYITGLFQNTADFDPGPGVFNLTAFSNDIYIAKLDAAGNFGWAIKYGGTTLDAGLSIFVSSSGNIYVTGYFEEVVDFDPGPGITALNSSTGRTFIVNLGNSVVPLTLLEFSGKPVGAGNLLTWKTAQEINTKHFGLERSGDGQQYNTIATLPAAGNSYQIIYYNYVHQQPANGNNFYRLKMVDTDGRFTYSPVIVVNNNTGSSSVKIFPNPVTDIFQLQIDAEKEETIVCNLYSDEGKISGSKKIKLQKGINQISWNIQTLARGNYFLSFPDESFKAKKIIKK